MKTLVAIDGSATSYLAVELAATLHWPAGSSLELIAVVPTDRELFGGPWPAIGYIEPVDVRARLAEELRRHVDESAERLEAPGRTVTARVLHGRPASTIVEEAEHIGADLIVLGARGHGTLERLLLGSVSAEVVDRAHCPVLVAREPTARRLLIGSDGEPDADLAVDFVAGKGLFTGAAARVLSVVDVPIATWLGVVPGDASASADAYETVAADAHARACDIVRRAAERLSAAGIAVEETTRTGAAASSIVVEAKSWSADLIVVGTRGLGLFQRLLLGSTARNVLHHADASVLIVRPHRTGVTTT